MNNNKRVYIIHRWDGAPQNCWIPWLKRELEARDFFVVVPKMPEAEKPDIQAWISHLNNVAGEVDENTFFVGHSIGCQAILRFVENFVQ
ncbi:MAG: alpha/beta hydrolase [Patescibacteria group bacterium]